MRRFGLSMVGLFALSTPVNAASQTATATFNVTLNIQKQCSVAAPSTINLGTVGAGDLVATTLSGTASYTVTCSQGTPYSIGFSSPNDLTTGGQIHQMKGTGQNSSVVQYNLFDANSIIPLDSLLHVVSDLGTGTAQTKSVKAQIVNYTTAVAPDTYTDTVTMTITY